MVLPLPTGPAGEYCRICRAKSQHADTLARRQLDGTRTAGHNGGIVQAAVSSQNVFSGGGDLDIVAIPYVFKYLCAELASMGITVSLEVK